MSPPSLLKNIASIREGNLCRASARLIKRSQARVFKLKNKKVSGSNQDSVRGQKHTVLGHKGCGGANGC